MNAARDSRGRVVIDLSHPIEDGMPAFPGLPSPRITALLDHEQSRSCYDGKAEFNLGYVEMAGNTGTYLDSPFHRHRDAADVSQIALSDIAGVGATVVAGTLNEDRSVDIELPEDRAGGGAILIETGWDVKWGSEEYWRGPYLSAAAVDLVMRSAPKLVGVDFANADDVDDPARPVHTSLLRAGIVIVENLTGLDRLPRTGLRFFAVPPAIVRAASFPVRAFAEVEQGEAP